MSKLRATNELTVLTADSIHQNTRFLTRHSRKAWNPVVLGQLAQKLAVARNSKEFIQQNPVKVEAHFQNGTVAAFLFIPEDYTLFQIHEAVRDEFSPILKNARNVSFNLLHLSEKYPWTSTNLIDALSSLVILTHWKRPNFETMKYTEYPKPNYGFYTSAPKEVVEEIIRVAELKAHATNQVRTLALMPPNMLGSKELVDFALERAKKMKVEIQFFSINDLKKMGAGGFCAVVQASESEGGIVKITRHGKGKEIALVGKGVVFDTGGLDLKTEGSMLGMNRDMTGAAVALSTFEALAKIDPTLNLSCYLAIGENLIGPNAYKPGDVLYMLTGESIEIENTDAEGRLMLADTLAMVNKHTKPNSLIIDFATLTGAAVDVAGTTHSLALTRRESLFEPMRRAGVRSGERMITGLPIGEEFEDAVTSAPDTDLSQCTNYPQAEHLYAAAFLTRFISKDKDHIHVDLACEFSDGGLGLVKSNTTGFGVRWAVEFILKSVNHKKQTLKKAK